MSRKSIMASLLLAGAIGTGIIIRSLLNEAIKQDQEEDDEINFINIKEEIDDEDEDELLASNASPEVEEIAKLYPYLKKDFIAEQFERNDAFNREYPEDTLITISHKARFVDEEVRKAFVGIAEENGYMCKEDEDNVEITKKMFTEDGSILSDIYNVSNQVACLKGTYKGYKID